MTGRDRGQMVLLAAVAIGVALVPMLLAYLQLGYHPNVAEPQDDHALDVDRTLDRELVEATVGIPASYDWSNRDGAVTAVRTRLAPTLRSLNRSAVARATAIQVSYNRTLARQWAATNCPSGPARQFGHCEADRGVVVQERAGETHVLAIGVEIRILSADAERIVRRVLVRD